MKILHLSSEKTFRGGERQIAFLIEELNKLGVENLALVRADSDFEKYCSQYGIPYETAPFKNEIDFATAIKIKSLARDYSPDLIHAHTSKAHGLAFLAAKAGCPTKIIAARRVDFPLNKNFFTKMKYNSPQTAKIICVSEAIRKIVSDSIDNPAKCLVIRSGVDVDKFVDFKPSGKLRDQYSIPRDDKIIANLSALAEHKDYFTFLDAAETLLQSRDDLKFFVFGDGPMREEIATYAKNKNLNGSVIFTGYVENADELLPEIDVFLMSSKTEGLGTAVLDAMAAGTPVCATYAGGIPEMIDHNFSGLLAPVGKSKLIAENVRKILDDAELRERLILGAKRKVRDFDKKIVARKTLEVYESVLSDG